MKWLGIVLTVLIAIAAIFFVTGFFRLPKVDDKAAELGGQARNAVTPN